MDGDCTAPNSAASTTTTKAVLVAQVQDAISASFALVPILVGIATVLAVGVLFLIAYLNVFDNLRAIALLDQLGYQPRDSLGLVINASDYHLVLSLILRTYTQKWR